VEFKNKAENNSSNKRIRLYTTDGGGEFVNRRFRDLFAEKGITHQIAPPYTKEPSGLIERPNRTLLDKVRAILSLANLPNYF